MPIREGFFVQLNKRQNDSTVWKVPILLRAASQELVEAGGSAGEEMEWQLAFCLAASWVERES